jgi:hypothetical protein
MKTNILSLKSFLVLLLILLGANQRMSGQVYLLENFDSAFVGVPGAPPGWSQTRFDYWGNGTPTALNIAGPKDWQRNRVVSAGVWSSQSFGTIPSAAVTDSGALWLEDYYFGTSTNMLSRRIESPTVNLATATSPYLRFNMFFAQNSNYTYPIMVMASNDNGATWKSIMHVQPNADVIATTTSGSGTMNAATPWSKITIKIPDAYKVANAKFAFYRNNPYSFNSNPFIDSLTIEEFTPTTITSAQTGNWADPATWVGGVIPNSNNNVVIAASHVVTSNVNISRMQDLTVNGGGSFLYFSTATNTVSQIFGNLTIDTLGSFNIGTSGSSAVSRWLYVGGNLSNNGTLNMGTSTAATLYLTGGTPGVFSNNGTVINNYISSIYFTNSAGTSFNPTMNNNVVIRNSLFLIDGPVSPNGKLVVGLSANTMALTRGCEKAYFTQRPIYPALGAALRSVTYGGGTNGNPTMGIFYKDTIFVGNETDTLSTGVHFIRGTFTMNTQNHVKLRNPLQIGDTIGATTIASATNQGGLTTFSRGILFTNDVNILTVGPIGNGSVGAAPSLNNVTPPTTHGSYVVGPVRFIRPIAGVLTSTLSLPFGYGSEYLQLANPNNVRRYMQVSAGAGWAGQIITARALNNASGSVGAPQSSLLTNKMYQLSLQTGQNLPATSILTISTMEEAGGVANRDVLLGNQDQLFIMQSANANGPWVARSLTSGTGAFATNTTYTKSTSATAPGPISGNGEFYAWGTSAPLMNFQSGSVTRETGPVSIGAQDMAILQVKVTVNGQIPTNVTRLNFNTSGTSRLAAISSAKVYYTGNNAGFSNSTQFGATVTAPSGNIALTGNQVLVNGDNYFWIAYNVSSGALIGDSLRANLDSIVVVDTARILVTTPTIGYRVVSLPMTFVSASANQINLSKVEVAAANEELLLLTVNMSPTGAPISASNFALTTNGSANPSGNIGVAAIYYSGSSNNFSTAQLIGTLNNPNGAFNISGNQNLLNGVNYFWLAYNIRATANIGDSVDGTWDSVTIAGVSRVVANNNPTGSRGIRAAYCPSNATSAADEEIWNVTFGTLNNTSTCTTTGGPGSTLSFYSNYSATVAAPNIPAGIPRPFSVNAASCGGNYPSSLGIYIDYNQNGIFDLPTELAYSNNAFTSSNVGAQIISGNITVPCTALSGKTRMRVVLTETTVGTTSCGTYTWGETEDYTINIVNGPATFTNTTAVQITGSTSAGATDVPVLRVPVKVTASPCNPGVITNFRFNTSGTTAVANIVSAKLYKTGASASFNTNNLLGTITSPSGQMEFIVADTALNDTNNYWLAYDVSATAPNANILDARFDSVEAFGSFNLPITGNPAGNRTITSPMTYLSSTASHPTTTYVTPGATNAQLLRVRVINSSVGSPIFATIFNLNTTGGGLDTLNIATSKLFYTGGSSTFATTNLFGSYSVVAPTSAIWPTYQITGNQQLLNDTNYFWLVYDMKAGAILGDSVDAEVTGITIAGVSQTPLITAPIGYRKIRADYCASAATLTGDEDIFGVQFGSLNNTSGCTTVAPGPGSANQFYANYTTSVAAPDISAGIATTINITKGTCGGFYGEVISVYIDLNQDGLFTGTGENVYNSAYAVGVANQVISGSITIPCTALSGITRMRVVYVEGTAAPACGTYGWGETEDYNINIVNGPATFISTTAMQITGSTSAGATDIPILRVPVKVTASPCNPGVITNMRFNTNGTTAVANIVSAKLYKTGTSATFNTNNLVGTIFAPSGQMEFIIADTAVNDTNNYWLAYDISATAPNANVLDARFDSIQAFGSFYLPVNGNPAGNRVISVPMTYVSSTSVHTELTAVQPSSTANRMLRMMVRTGSTGAPIALTQFSLNTNGGGNDTMNIANAKVFYTGASPNFAATTQFGATYTVTGATTATWPAYQINGSQTLLNDTNYFWLTYDLKAGAILLDSVDAEVTGMVIAGVSQTPTVTAPIGNRRIRQAYCVSSATTIFDGEIFNVTAGNLNNTSSCTTTGGAGSTLNQYSDYTTTVAPADFYVGAPASINIHAATCGGQYNGVVGAWIDYNQDGDFTDAGETVYMSTSFLYGVGIFVGGSFIVPATATLGNTRMRVALIEGGTPPISSCGTYGYGETEDYLVNILPAVGGSFVWNGSVSTNATIPANWTPARNTASPYDKLIFNSATPLSITNVPATNLGVIELTPSTVVTFAGTAGNVVAVRDSMNLGAGSRLNTGTLIAQLGWDTTNIGLINGTGRINGNLNRYFNSTLTSIDFPFTNATNANRTASIAYTTFPVNSGLLSGSFVNATPGNAGLPLTDLSASITANRAGINGYWTMNTPVTGGTYTATYTGGAFTGVNAYLGLLLLRRSDAVSSWTLSGTHVTTTGSNALPVLSRSGLTVYGEFAMGGDTISNPLPVNMLFFAAKNLDGNVQLNWATANEINNKGFGVERSINGVDFTELSFVKGNGTINKNVNYAMLDKRAFELTVSTQLYYRLRQEDFDGSVNYSNTVMVSEDDFSDNSVEVYPNPFVNTVGVKFVSASNETANVEITDMQGRVISTEKVKVNAGNFYHQMASVENMSNGVYFVSVTINGVKQTTKVVKTN